MRLQFLHMPGQAMTVIVVWTLAVFLVALYWSSHNETVIALHDMPCADLDGDGEVTTMDEQIIWSYWGQNVPPAPPQANLHPGPPVADNDVDINDVQYLLARIGQLTDCQDTPIVAKGTADLVIDSIEDVNRAHKGQDRSAERRNLFKAPESLM